MSAPHLHILNAGLVGAETTVIYVAADGTEIDVNLNCLSCRSRYER